MKNNLDNDKSPYLQQHKNNPVYWQTWQKESLGLAKEQKKPILLSIGYASCHWCHVMAHESFEDSETANLMNKFFVNIKVDREERPDIDFIFQSSFQLFNQSGGGWPLTIFLDENAVPFMAGTYFPKEEKNGLPSFKHVLKNISKVYSEQREKIISQSQLIKKSLELKKNSVLSQDLEPILDDVISNLDPIKGGYKGAPKFPMFNVFDTLLYFYNKTKKEKFLKPVALILKQLCSQGIYDHVEGGISRYTVDENWLIPHFEKMLYDNSQFVLLLSKYLKINPTKYYRSKIIQTINYFNKNFINKNNQLLGSAYDADSDGVEGKYYTYNYDEIRNINEIDKYFEIKEKGNWEGKIILKELKAAPEQIITKLKKIRLKKNKPFFDSKTQLDLNSLWISSLISADTVIPNQGYLNQAEELYDQLDKYFSENNLFHSNSKSVVFIEDYAFYISSLIDLHEKTLNLKYKIKAIKITKRAIEKFYIMDKAIFQKNELDTNDLFFRPIDIGDHTIPNGNSVMLMNLTRLGFKNEAKELANSLNGYLNIYKTFMISSVKSIDYLNQIESNKKCNHEGCSV